MAKKSVEREITVQEDLMILREAMKERLMTQVDLADKLGILQSSLSGSLNRKRASVEVFCRILDAMDYDVAVIDRETGEVMWKVAVK